MGQGGYQIGKSTEECRAVPEELRPGNSAEDDLVALFCMAAGFPFAAGFVEAFHLAQPARSSRDSGNPG